MAASPALGVPGTPNEDSIAHIVDCISDDKLQDAAFFAFLRRVAILSAGASISDPAVEQQIKYAVQVLWELLKKSGHLLKQKYARYIANESHLVNSTIEANLSTCLEPQETRAQLFVHTHLLHLICNSITILPETVTNIQGCDQIIKNVLKITTSGQQLYIDATYERSIIAMVLILYACAISIPTRQLLKENLPGIGSLIHLPSTEIKLLSKALVARLIPTDATRDDMAVLMLIEDDEADYLISMLSPVQSIPIISVISDLCRSPHNMWALASRDVALKLSDIMDNISEDDQSKAAQLIYRMVEFCYEGNEEVSQVINGGTQSLREEDYRVKNRDDVDEEGTESDLVSCIANCIKSFESGIINTDTMVTNVSAAIAFQFSLMEQSDEFKEESARSIDGSHSSYSAIQKLTSLIGIVHFKEATKILTQYDVHVVVLKCLLWWTSHSEAASTGLAKTGIITNLCNLLPIFIRLNLHEKTDLCLKIMINCVSDSSNLPAFNSNISQSDSVLSVLPLTHGQMSNLSVRSKMLLALLNPLLDCEQLHALKLTKSDANILISLLSQALEDSYHLAQDSTLLTLLRVMIWFTQEYSKPLGKKACSEYENKLNSVTDELKSNLQLLVKEGILLALKPVLKLNGQEELQAAAARVIWNLAHNAEVKSLILNDSDNIGVLQDLHTLPLPKLSMATHCALWILGLQTNGPRSLLQYAKGCLEFMNYFECIEVCDKILKNNEDESITIQAKIVKGKARFYSYKRKLHYVLLNTNIRETKDRERLVINESFDGMKETIALLGTGLDHNMLDEEGSVLLDWAMIDCLSTTNQLNLCKRCLLCRQKRSLQRSHVWPRFLFNVQPDEKEFIFGLDKHQLKSVGQCTFWMLCARCEELLSQNGENDFKTKFPTSGEITYSPWLFSFCAGVIFRTLSIANKFPMHFNDSEIHKVLLHCRRHLLSLPVTVSDKVASLEKCNKRDFEELAEKLKDNLDIYIFMSPLKSQRNYRVFQIPYPNSAFAVSRNKQLDNKSLIFNGHAHFFGLFCGPITIIVQFDQSLLSLENKGFHITSNPADSDERYTIPSEEDRVQLLPVGVWPLLEQLAEGTMDDSNQFSRFISRNFSKEPIPQPTPSVDVPLELSNKAMFQVCHLPKGYEVLKPNVKLPRNQCVVLPKGHCVLIHTCRLVPMQNVVMMFLLCINGPNSTSDNENLYIIYSFQDNNSRILYVDAAVAEVEGEKLVLTKYLLQNKIVDAMRISLSSLNSLLSIALPNRHFANIDILVHLVKYRRCISGPLSSVLPSLDRKCSPEGCWYCHDLCQHCMQPSSTLYSGVHGDHLLKFCSEECKRFWFPTPDHVSPHVASYLDGTCQSQEKVAPLLTAVVQKEKGVEQIYLSVDKASGDFERLDMPYIVWHIRELEIQHFAHFYITKDCLPLKSVWTKQCCTGEGEIISKYIAANQLEIQSHIQKQLNQAVKEYGFADFETFLKQVDGVSLYHETLPEVAEKVSMRSNLPLKFTLCSPGIGFAHGSLKSPLHATDLLHFTEVDDSVQTMYLFGATNLFNVNSPLQLHLISVKHHMEEDWYFADGVVLSIDCSRATEFLLDKAIYDRGPQTLDVMNGTVQRIIPKMFRSRGVPSIQPLLHLKKYTWLNPISSSLDLPCLAESNCWYCKRFCRCCSFFSESESGFCCEACEAMFNLDPSATPTVIFNEAELADIFRSNKNYSNFKDPPLIAFMKKVISTDLDKKYSVNTILRIYLCRSNENFQIVPQGEVFAICQIKSSSNQVLVDCLLSKDYVPLEPVWYSDYCEQMIDKHRALLHSEIMHLVTHTLGTSS